MRTSEYLAGFVFFAATLGGAAAVAGLVVAHRLAHLDGIARLLAGSLLATAALVGAHLVPLALGVLSRGTVLATSLLLALGVAIAVREGAAAEPDRFPATAPSPRWLSAVAVGAAVVSAGWIAAWLRPLKTIPIEGTDMLSFDLPMIGRWIQDGSLWSVSEFFPLQPHGAYPHNGDLVMLSAVLPWKSDMLVRFVDVPFLALLGCAVYALARELAAPAAVAVIAAVAAVTLPVVTICTTYQLLPDPVLWATFVTGVFFLVRASRTGRRPDLLLAGLGLGLAFGTKWYGPPAVAAVLFVWAIAGRLSGRELGAQARDGLMLAGTIALAGGFWLIRNTVEYGSPVFPSSGGLFDVPSDPLREAVGFRLVDYLDDPGILGDYAVPAFRRAFGLVGAALALGLLVLAALGATGRRGIRRSPLLAITVSALLIAVIYAFLPYSALGREGAPVDIGANTRYALPALFLAAAACAAAFGRSTRWQAVLVLAGVAAALDGLTRSPLDAGAGTVVLFSIALGVVVVALATVHTAGRGMPRSPWLRGLAAVVCVGVVVVAGQRHEDAFFEHRYRAEPTFAWISEQAPDGRRVGVAGTWTLKGPPPTWPMYGPRAGNEVAFVGHVVDGQLRRYSDFEAWRRAASRFDLVLMGKAPAPERDWADRAGFRRVAESDRFQLYATGRG
jgi:hypothetical protein